MPGTTGQPGMSGEPGVRGPAGPKGEKVSGPDLEEFVAWANRNQGISNEGWDRREPQGSPGATDSSGLLTAAWSIRDLFFFFS